MNSYGKINSVLEQIYEQGGQIHIDSDTIIQGDLQVSGNLSVTGSGGGSGSTTKIENGTGKVEVVSASKIETKLNNNLVLEQEIKTGSTDSVVFTTHFSSDSFFLEELVYNAQQQYPFTALMNATSIIKIGVDMSYIGSPTVKISIADTNVTIFATVTVQLPNNATLTETTYPFIGFNMSQNIVEGDNYLLLLTRIDNTPANTINIFGTGLQDYNSVGTINPHSRVNFLIRGTGSHTPKIHHKFTGRVEAGEVYDVEEAIRELQSHHTTHHYTLQSHSADSNLHGKSLEAFGTDSIFTKDFFSSTPSAMTDSILIGKEAGLHFNTLTQDGLIIIGNYAGNKGLNTGSVAIGKQACRYIFNGQVAGASIAIGIEALKGVSGDSSASLNISIGSYAARDVTTAYRNVIIGMNNAIGLSTGYNNVSIGAHGSGSNSLTTERNNTLLGSFTDILPGVNNSIALGFLAQATLSNQMIIGNASASNGVIQVVPGLDNNTDLGSSGLRFKDCYLSGNLSCANLTVSGELKVVNTSIVEISDNAIKLASGNIADNMDSGIYAQYNDGASKYTGLIRNSTNGTYHIFDGLATEPTSTTDFANSTRANLDCGTINGVTIQTSAGTTDVGDLKTTSSSFVHNGANGTVHFGAYNRRFNSIWGLNLNLTGLINSVLEANSLGYVAPPSTASNISLGISSQRWLDIYSVNSPTHSSDRNLKKEIVDSDLGLDFVNKLRPVRYKFRENQSDRPHYGLISQEVRDTINDMKIDFAGYIYGDTKKVAVTNEETGEVTVKEEQLETPFYGLRYTEFIGPMLKAIQELSVTVNELKAEIEILKAKIN